MQPLAGVRHSAEGKVAFLASPTFFILVIEYRRIYDISHLCTLIAIQRSIDTLLRTRREIVTFFVATRLFLEYTEVRSLHVALSKGYILAVFRIFRNF